MIQTVYFSDHDIIKLVGKIPQIHTVETVIDRLVGGYHPLSRGAQS